MTLSVQVILLTGLSFTAREKTIIAFRLVLGILTALGLILIFIFISTPEFRSEIRASDEARGIAFTCPLLNTYQIRVLFSKNFVKIHKEYSRCVLLTFFFFSVWYHRPDNAAFFFLSLFSGALLIFGYVFVCLRRNHRSNGSFSVDHDIEQFRRIFSNNLYDD